MLENALSWFFPLLLTTAYAGLAAYAHRWVILRYQTRLRHPRDMWSHLLRYLLGWPLIVALVLSGVLILGEFWPLSAHQRNVFHVTIKIVLIVALALVAQQWFVSAYRFSRPTSWMRITLLRKLLLTLIYVTAALMVLDAMQINISPLLASLGIGSLAVALAVNQILGNFFAGIQLAVERPIEVGQSVTLENGMTGQVLALDWMKTHLRAEDGSRVIVPNARMTGFILQNLTLSEPESAVIVKLAIDRASDLERAEQVALETAARLMARPGEEAPPTPTAYYTKLAGAGAELTVMLSARDHASVAQLRSAYLKALNQAYEAAGIKVV